MNHHILMLCHDQHLDRRVVAQGQSLIESGNKVTLICLSYTNEDSEEYLSEGIHLIRIGLKHIIPSNKIYICYIACQKKLNHLLNQLCNLNNKAKPLWTAGFKLFSRINWIMYKTLLCIRYFNKNMGDPLPFKDAFFTAASMFTPDLIQVHDLPALAAGVDLAKKWRIPLVYDAHELYPEQRSFSFIQRRICSREENQLIKACTKVFTVNDSIALEMATRYAILRPVTLINALDPHPQFYPNASYNVLREKLKLDISRKIVLFQGGFSPNRNLEQLIKAMTFVTNSKVVLVMMGFGDFGRRLQKAAEHLGLLNSRVYFLPAVPQSELLQHATSADIGIIPYPHVDLNSYYCTPNKLFEFIQAALPILANDSPELKRFVHNTGFGLVQPMGTSRQIASAIDEVFADSNRCAAYRMQLKKQRQAYTWQVHSTIYLDVMKSCLEHREIPMEKNEIFKPEYDTARVGLL